MSAKAKNDHANIQTTFYMNFLPGKKYGVPSQKFVKKMFCAKKGDEITRFDCTYRRTFKNGDRYRLSCAFIVKCLGIL
jgi:hypothetical protein